MQVTVLYTVLTVKTLSQNSSIGIITSPHCLTEVRTSSAERKKWKQKEKICSLRIPLANECSAFEFQHYPRNKTTFLHPRNIRAHYNPHQYNTPFTPQDAVKLILEFTG